MRDTDKTTHPAAASPKRGRSAVAVVLVVLASLGIVASTIGFWVRSTAFDTDSFMEVVESTIRSDEVGEAIADQVADEVITSLDLATRFEQRLGAIDEYLASGLIETLDPGPETLSLLRQLDVPGFSDLAIPLSEAINDEIRSAVTKLLDNEDFESILIASIRRGHEAAVALIRDDLENVNVVDGEVKLNLVPAIVAALGHVIEQGIAAIGPELTLPEITVSQDAVDSVREVAVALGADLPDDFGQVTLMTAEQLGELQTGVRSADRLVWATLALTVLLIAAAVVVSPHRRRTVVQVGVGAAAALAVSILLLDNITDAIEKTVSDPEARNAVRAVLATVFRNLEATFRGLFVAGVLVGIAAYLIGRPDWVERRAATVRGVLASGPAGSLLDRWVSHHHDGAVVAVILTGVVVLGVVGISFVSTVLVGAVTAAFLSYTGVAKRRIERVDSVVDDQAAETPVS